MGPFVPGKGSIRRMQALLTPSLCSREECFFRICDMVRGRGPVSLQEARSPLASQVSIDTFSFVAPTGISSRRTRLHYKSSYSKKDCLKKRERLMLPQEEFWMHRLSKAGLTMGRLSRTLGVNYFTPYPLKCFEPRWRRDRLVFINPLQDLIVYAFVHQ